MEPVSAELVYFREDGRRHTLLTIAGPLFMPMLGYASVKLHVAVHDRAGQKVGAVDHVLDADGAVFIDSRELARAVPGLPEEGALVVWVTPTSRLPDQARADYSGAGSMVDWFSDDGQLASLHSDQTLRQGTKPIEWTEVVFREEPGSPTSLVIVNGPERQPERGLELVVRNVDGAERAATYDDAMAPFAVHRVVLGDVFPELTTFCRGAEASLRGRFGAKGIFTRPYVMTEGQLISAYHGGDRYHMAPIPRALHRTFPSADATAVPREVLVTVGQKEMNPAYAVHGPGLTTRLHLFQSHGAIDDDFPIDVTAYDRDGRVVAHRDRWAVAPRHGATTVDVAELVGGARFEGHLALRFSDRPVEAFPRRLQALLEYRTPVSVARMMLWSDRWNAPDRLSARVPHRALYRVFPPGPLTTTLAISNASVSADYDREASYTIRLWTDGDVWAVEGTLPPHGTRVASIDELFPDRPAGVHALAIVESDFDLASMQLTRDARSGVVSAEHLMAVIAVEDGRQVLPAGA